MGDRKLHPFESTSDLSIPPSLLPSLTSSPGNNVTFHEATKRRDSSVSQDQQQTTTSQLRNRMDTKLAATSDLNSSLAMNTSCASNSAAVAGGGPGSNEPRTLIKRSNTGPGGRSLDEDDSDSPKWTSKVSKVLQDFYNKYSPSLTLENKGSIARDHLANERTYLAWLRTSLSLITVGVAVTQLFRLQTNDSKGGLISVSDMGRPLGGSFIALGIVFLWLGTSRYFHSQSVLSYGQFPASRGSVIVATITVLSVLLACFIIVILQDTGH